MKYSLDLYEEGIKKSSKLICEEIVCDTRAKLKNTMTAEQIKMFDFLNENIYN